MSRSSNRSELCLTTLAAAIATASNPAVAQTFTVTNKNATGPGSFLYAVQSANESGDLDDNIQFSISGTLTLGEPLPPLVGDLAINGPGSGALTIDAIDLTAESPLLRSSGGDISVSGLRIDNTTYGALEITSEGTLELDDVLISGVSATEPLVQAGSASTTLTINNSVFTGNDFDDDAAIQAGNEANVTITNSIISGNTSSRTPALSVEYAQASLDGVTIKDNTNTGSNTQGSGAIYILNSPVEIVNSTLTGNSADNQYEGDSAGGGAILLRSSITASLTVTDSTLSNNSSADGGAIKMTGDPSLEISDSVLSGNETTGFGSSDGGAISGGYDGSISINRSTFSGNFAYDDGGAINVGYVSMDITDSVFKNNRAFDDGGAIRSSGSLSITSSTLVGNRADDTGKPDDESSNRGGAIYKFDEESLNIADSVLRDNVAATDGGAISVQGNLSMSNTLVDGNVAEERGGGISIRGLSYGDEELDGVTVTGNKAPTGAAMSFEMENGQDVLISSSTISNNTASDGAALEFLVENYSDVLISRSTISGNRAGGTASAINVGVDPDEPDTTDYSFLYISNSTLSGNRASNAAAVVSVSNVESGLIASSTLVDNVGSGAGSTQVHFSGAQYYNGAHYTTESPNFSITNSIVSSNNNTEVFIGGDVLNTDGSYYTAGDSLEPTVTIADSNLEQGFSSSEGATLGTANVANEDPELGSLSANGGGTLTHAPLSAASPGIDSGEGGRPDGEDQRGVADQGTTDLGSVEYVTTNLAPPKLASNILSQLGGKPGKVIEGIVVADAFTDPDGVVTVSVDGLPAGLSYTGGTDTIAGTLEADGEYFVTVTVADEGSPALETTVQGRVVVKNKSPVFIDTGEGGGGSVGGGLVGLLGLIAIRRLRRR